MSLKTILKYLIGSIHPDQEGRDESSMLRYGAAIKVY